ncbi:PEGA domain-containing protein [Candidatus Woesearchaeota archaeon]|nr:PEGA domain-containing protein [Candidatus Woesearchaeota archaeon]
MDNKHYIVFIAVLLLALSFVSFNLNNQYSNAEVISGNLVKCSASQTITCSGKVVCCNTFKYCEDCPPNYALNPNTCSGCVRAVGTIDITSNPNQADVFINSVNKGKTHYYLGDLAPGKYTIKVSKPGYLDAAKTVDIQIAKVTSVDFNLVAVGKGSVKVMTSPGGATVYIDNEYMGITTAIIPDVTAGKHNIRITRSGYADINEIINISPDEQIVISKILAK